MKFGKKNIVILISLLTVLFVFLAILANSFMNKELTTIKYSSKSNEILTISLLVNSINKP